MSVSPDEPGTRGGPSTTTLPPGVIAQIRQDTGNILANTNQGNGAALPPDIAKAAGTGAFAVNVGELLQLAKVIDDAGLKISEFSCTVGGLNLPDGAFGHLPPSDDALKKYEELRLKVAGTLQKGYEVLHSVNSGLLAVGAHYRDQDGASASAFEG